MIVLCFISTWLKYVISAFASFSASPYWYNYIELIETNINLNTKQYGLQKLNNITSLFENTFKIVSILNLNVL